MPEDAEKSQTESLGVKLRPSKRNAQNVAPRGAAGDVRGLQAQTEEPSVRKASTERWEAGFCDAGSRLIRLSEEF